ncbi:hypothetical protein [Streptomyces lasalocidi]|uniref:Uncharacterized protein n=1 Tax=Streptomyces lasalocidi TaxID=324833 RepID=A0A4U5WCY3_STRLS|nr:hypothetical protein [Streptomyces lasalocidi]TKS99548.1 hypothetical protein E4U91_05030 [Streptomyces lasalocidi]
MIDQLAGAEPAAARSAAVVPSSLEWAEGRTAQALHCGRRPAAAARPGGRRRVPRLALAAKLVALGGTEEAEELLGQVSAKSDDAVHRPAADLVRAAGLRAGDLNAARRRARDAGSAASDSGLPGLAAWAWATLCRADLLADDTGSAAGHLTRAAGDTGRAPARSVDHPRPRGPDDPRRRRGPPAAARPRPATRRR